MSAPPYMKLFWADYHQDTRHLSRSEHGAYFLLIGEAWNRGGVLPDDDALLARWTISTTKEWAALKPIIMAFFVLSGGRWKHKRIVEELGSYAAVSRKRKAAGKKGGSATRGKDSENHEANAVPIASQKPTKPEPEPEPEEKVELTLLSPDGDEAKAKAQYPDLFERAWRAYPHVKGRSSKKVAMAIWRKLPKVTQTTLPEACSRYAKDGREPNQAPPNAPAMDRWLRDEKFVDWMVAVAAYTPDLAALPKFPNEPIRSYVVQHKGEPFAVSYLDSCSWSEADGGRTITAPNTFVASKLKADVPALEQRGIRITVQTSEPKSRSAA